MFDTKCLQPYMYLLEFHIGDGYFDRQSIGKFSVSVSYRDGASILVSEKERGDDRLVKFRQGKSIIFGIANPSDKLSIRFEAYDDNNEIGKSTIYFLGIASPKLLAVKSQSSPIASVITTNLQLSRDAGSLQIFARLTCFGQDLITDFSVSNESSTQFDTYVCDVELVTDDNVTKKSFMAGEDLVVTADSNVETVDRNPEASGDLVVTTASVNEGVQKEMVFSEEKVVTDEVKISNSDTVATYFYEAKTIHGDISMEMNTITVNDSESISQEISDVLLRVVEKVEEEECEAEKVETVDYEKLITCLTETSPDINKDVVIYNDENEPSSVTSIKNIKGQFALSADNSILDLNEFRKTSDFSETSEVHLGKEEDDIKLETVFFSVKEQNEEEEEETVEVREISAADVMNVEAMHNHDVGQQCPVKEQIGDAPQSSVTIVEEEELKSTVTATEDIYKQSMEDVGRNVTRDETVTACGCETGDAPSRKKSSEEKSEKEDGIDEKEAKAIIASAASVIVTEVMISDGSEAGGECTCISGWMGKLETNDLGMQKKSEQIEFNLDENQVLTTKAKTVSWSNEEVTKCSPTSTATEDTDVSSYKEQQHSNRRPGSSGRKRTSRKGRKRNNNKNN